MPDAMSIGVSGLRAFQSALNTVGHNIANVNTEGYSRQTVGFTTGIPSVGAGGQFGGSGVISTGVQRQHQAFLASQITSGNTTTQELETYNTYASRLDDLYADPETGAVPVIQSFFDSLQALSADSGSAAARQLVLSDAESMAARFNQLYERSDEIRRQVNDAVSVSVSELQSHAESLAAVNNSIVRTTAANGGVTPPDLLDQRDQLVNEMAKLTSVRTVAQDDGALNLFIGNGLPLVIGSTTQKLATQPSTSDPGAVDIVLRQTAGSAPQVVTEFMGGGRIGGLERFRDEILTPSQGQLGLVAMGIADQINAQHRLGTDLNNNLGGDFFKPLTATSFANSTNTGTGEIGVTIGDTNQLTGDEYRLTSIDGTDFRLMRLSDEQVIYTGTLPASEATLGEGFALSLASGAAAAGDSFLIRPTHAAARDIQLALSNTSAISAGSPVITDPNGATSNTGTGRISQPELTTRIDPPGAWPGDITLTYNSGTGNFAASSGTVTDNGDGSFTLTTPIGNVGFSLTGVPANGDTFEIRRNTSGLVADNRNAVAMAEMHNQRNLLDGDATYVGTFSKMVAMVGTETRQSEIAYKAQEGLLMQAKAAHSEVSGVNLDEEAANLLRYQQAYQAAAQLVSIAQSTFQTLLSAVRG